MENKVTGKRSKRSKILKAAGVLVLVGVVSAYAYRQGTQEVLALVERNKEAGIGISLVVYALIGATVIPSEPLTLLLTAAYGPVLAIAVATVGTTLAALVEYFIGGSLGDLADFERRKEKLPFHLSQIPIDSPVFLFLGRMLPGFGSKFVSLACGVYNISLFTFVWTAVLSNLFGAAMVAMGGFGLLTWIKGYF